MSDNNYGARVTLRMLFRMMKPTISLLVVVTAIPTLFMAGDGNPSVADVLVTLVGTFLASGSAGIFNHLADSDIDGFMVRTKSRPLPTGKVSETLALSTGIALGMISFAMLYFGATPLSAFLALSANVFYVVIYTMYLKRTTVQNIVIGGAAGAVGPLIGWSAVTGTLSWQSWVLFAIIFLWTPPHFWALAIKYRDDYARAGIPMLPSVKGVLATKKQILIYSILLLPAVIILPLGGSAGWIYSVFSVISTVYFIVLAWKLFKSQDETSAMPLFFYSCFYLFGIFGALTIDKLLL